MTQAKQIQCFREVLNNVEVKENGNLVKWNLLFPQIAKEKELNHIPLSRRKKEEHIDKQIENHNNKRKRDD